MEIGSRTQTFIAKCIELKGVEAETEAAYQREVEATNANANVINGLEARMLTEPVTEEMLVEWRAARQRMVPLDQARRDAYARARDVRMHFSVMLSKCFTTFKLEHIGNEGEDWPEP